MWQYVALLILLALVVTGSAGSSEAAFFDVSWVSTTEFLGGARPDDPNLGPFTIHGQSVLGVEPFGVTELQVHSTDNRFNFETDDRPVIGGTFLFHGTVGPTGALGVEPHVDLPAAAEFFQLLPRSGTTHGEGQITVAGDAIALHYFEGHFGNPVDVVSLTVDATGRRQRAVRAEEPLSLVVAGVALGGTALLRRVGR